MAVLGGGSCICGDVKYTISEKPVLQIYCHCTTCRKLTSSTHGTFIFIPRNVFNLTISPSPSSLATHPLNTPSVAKAAPNLSSFSVLHESGMNLTFHWCSRCGTKIYKETDVEEQKDLVLIAAGTLDGREIGEDGVVNGHEGGFGVGDIKIEKEFNTKDRLPWVRPMEGVEQHQRF